MFLNNIPSALVKQKALVLCSERCRKGYLGGKDEPGSPSPSTPGTQREILLPFIFSGWSRNWSEGGHEGESE